MTARKLFVAGEVFSISGAGYEPIGQFWRDGQAVAPTESMQLLLRAAALASDTHILYDETIGRWQVKGDPTEGALVVAAAKAGLQKTELDEAFPRIGEIPFTSESKRMTTLHTEPEGVTAYAKGAPEVILAACTRHLTTEGESILDEAGRETILDAARHMATEALRVLAVAAKTDIALESAEQEMTFLGLVGMIDPPRPEAKAAIELCEQAGIKPVMITGDHPLTAQAVARELGLLKQGRVITGAQLEEMNEADFEREVENIEVYARVSPAHKLRVVAALQQKEHIVAMTGDGVNDAPALKKADIGIAMGITGTDVTKWAAAMTLTDDPLILPRLWPPWKRAGVFLTTPPISDVLLLQHRGIGGMAGPPHLARCPLPPPSDNPDVNLATLVAAVGPPGTTPAPAPPQLPPPPPPPHPWAAVALNRRPTAVRQPGHRWPAGAGLGRRPAGSRVDAPETAQPAHRHLHPPGGGVDAGRGVVVYHHQSGRLYLGAEFGPQFGRGHDYDLCLAGVDSVFQGVQLPLGPGFGAGEAFCQPLVESGYWLGVAAAGLNYLCSLPARTVWYLQPAADRLGHFIALAFTGLPVREVVKWAERRGWLGELS